MYEKPVVLNVSFDEDWQNAGYTNSKRGVLMLDVFAWNGLFSYLRLSGYTFKCKIRMDVA